MDVWFLGGVNWSSYRSLFSIFTGMKVLEFFQVDVPPHAGVVRMTVALGLRSVTIRISPILDHSR
jgi:hypothetical protein